MKSEFEARASSLIVSLTDWCEEDLKALSENAFTSFSYFCETIANGEDALPQDMKPKKGFAFKGDMLSFGHAVFCREKTKKGWRLYEVIYRVVGNKCEIWGAGLHGDGEYDIQRKVKYERGAVELVRQEKEERRQNKVQGSFDDIEFIGSEGLDELLADIMGEELD